MGKFKFKTGDKIRCVDNEDYLDLLTVGKVYEVAENYISPDFVQVVDDIKRVSGFYVSRFEAVEEPAPKFRVGMRAWDMDYGWGTVAQAGSKCTYPLFVRFDTGGYSNVYTMDGRRYTTSLNASLFLDEVKPEDWPNPPAAKPKASELKVGQHIECTTNFTNSQYLRREVVFVTGEQVWVQDIYNENSSHKVIDWRLPSPE